MTTGRSRVALTALALASAAGLLLAPATAHAQLGKKDKKPSTPTSTTPTGPAGIQPGTPAAPKSILDDVIKRGRSHDWTLRVNVHLDAYQDQLIYTTAPVAPGGQPTTTPTTRQPTNPNDGQMPKVIPFKFDTAAVVFPCIAYTSSSLLAGKPVAKVTFDGKDSTSEVTWIEETGSGSRYGRWDMKDKQEGRQIDFDIELPVTTWETVFDEAKASKAIWPKSGRWPKECATSLAATLIGDRPVIDPNAPAVREALTAWTAGKPPQSVPPVQLAKFLAAKVLETVQPSGDGLISSKTGLLQGFYLVGPEQTLREAKGSEHDIACTLASIYRAAGIPARIVIGYDVTETKGSGVGLKRKPGGAVRSWVEFAVVDETAIMPASAAVGAGEPKTVWIPVDIMRQRKSSSRAPALDKPWKFFGFNDETDDVIPIAFQYHPPLAGVVAHGSPCFWGWITMPEMQHAEQMIRFTANTTARTAGPSGPSPYK